MTDFAPIPRKRRIPTDPDARREYMRELGRKGGAAGTGQAKNHFTLTEWKAMQRLGQRVIQANRAQRQQQA